MEFFNTIGGKRPFAAGASCKPNTLYVSKAIKNGE
jgi:hypothetical protein